MMAPKMKLLINMSISHKLHSDNATSGGQITYRNWHQLSLECLSPTYAGH
jgi:hypothetical protein